MVPLDRDQLLDIGISVERDHDIERKTQVEKVQIEDVLTHPKCRLLMLWFYGSGPVGGCDL